MYDAKYVLTCTSNRQPIVKTAVLSLPATHVTEALCHITLSLAEVTDMKAEKSGAQFFEARPDHLQTTALCRSQLIAAGLQIAAYNVSLPVYRVPPK